jgi:hypothetical protein
MIRVLRVLEYDYSDNEAAQVNMEKWAVPANGARDFGRVVIRSAVIIDLDPELQTVPDVPANAE